MIAGQVSLNGSPNRKTCNMPGTQDYAKGNGKGEAKMDFDVMKEKGGQYYITHKGQKVPGSYGDKKKVTKQAAHMNGLSVKDFLKQRKKEGGD